MRIVTSRKVVVAALTALAAGASSQAVASTPYATIASAGRLEGIFLGNELSCQVKYRGEDSLQFYPSNTTPGDCGTFLQLEPGELFAPDFDAHGRTQAGVTATAKLNSPTTFAPVSQSPVLGAGTKAAPFAVTTVVDVPGRDLRLTQTDSYIATAEAYRTDVTVQNVGGTARSGNLYRAGDCYLQGSDSGYGLVEGANPGCAVNAGNQPAGRVEQWVSLTPGNSFSEGPYGSDATGIWHQIGLRAPFNNAVDAAVSQDNGAGISWPFSLPAGGSATFSHYTVFSPSGLTGQPDFDPPTSAATAQPCANDGTAVIVTDAAGGRGAAAVHFRLDGGAEQRVPTTGNPGKASVPVADGRHTLEYWGEDVDGNLEADHKTVSVVADRQAPTLTITPVGGATSFFQGQRATAAVVAKDAISGLALDPSAPTVTIDTSHTGTRKLTRTATDACGNRTVTTFTYKVTSAATALGLPSARVCVSRRNFRIRIRRIKGVAYRSATVTVRGRKVITRKGKRITAPVDLRGLPKGTFTIRIVATTTKGKKLTGTRTYHTCVAGTKKAPL